MKGLLIQEFKTLFKSPASLSILIIPLVLLIGLGYLLPSGWIVPSSITIGIVGAVLLYFGGSIEEIKRTSFMKSISLTRMNKMTFLATKILFSVFVSMVAVLWVLFFAWISADVIGFLATDFSTLIPEDPEGGAMNIVRQVPFTINWDKVNWGMMIYAGMLTITVSVALAFVFVAFSKSSLSFYLMSFGYLLAMILFGGVVMPSFLISADTKEWFTTLYYLIPNYYTNNVMAQSFGGTLGATITNLTGGIDHLLFGEVFAGIDFDSFSEAEVTEITSFLLGSDGVVGGGLSKADWVGDLESLNAWYQDLVDASKNTANIDSFYNALVTPLTNAGVDSYGHLITLTLSTPVYKIAIAAGIDENIAMIIYNLLYNNASIDAIGMSLGNMLFGGTALTKPFIGFAIPPIGEQLLFGNIPFLVDDAATGVVNIIPTVHTVLDVINGMFNTAHSYDYYVPWIETAIFLGISTVFFKWS